MQLIEEYIKKEDFQIKGWRKNEENEIRTRTERERERE